MLGRKSFLQSEKSLKQIGALIASGKVGRRGESRG